MPATNIENLVLWYIIGIFFGIFIGLFVRSYAAGAIAFFFILISELVTKYLTK